MIFEFETLLKKRGKESFYLTCMSDLCVPLTVINFIPLFFYSINYCIEKEHKRPLRSKVADGSIFFPLSKWILHLKNLKIWYNNFWEKTHLGPPLSPLITGKRSSPSQYFPCEWVVFCVDFVRVPFLDRKNSHYKFKEMEKNNIKSTH